jgi:hypothetical protein
MSLRLDHLEKGVVLALLSLKEHALKEHALRYQDLPWMLISCGRIQRKAMTSSWFSALVAENLVARTLWYVRNDGSWVCI